MVFCPLDEMILDDIKRLLLIRIFPVIYIQQFKKIKKWNVKINICSNEETMFKLNPFIDIKLFKLSIPIWIILHKCASCIWEEYLHIHVSTYWCNSAGWNCTSVWNDKNFCCEKWLPDQKVYIKCEKRLKIPYP